MDKKLRERMNLQSKEFDAAAEFSIQLRRHDATAVVDDDYPSVRHDYEGALAGLISSMKANGRFGPRNRYGVCDVAKAAPRPAMQSTIVEVLAEIERATAKFPTWPTDPLHAIGVLGEEFGELTKAVMQATYEPHKNGPGAVHDEAVQTAAMALRFLASLDCYEYASCPQHQQAAS